MKSFDAPKLNNIPLSTRPLPQLQRGETRGRLYPKSFDKEVKEIIESREGFECHEECFRVIWVYEANREKAKDLVSESTDNVNDHYLIIHYSETTLTSCIMRRQPFYKRLY